MTSMIKHTKKKINLKELSLITFAPYKFSISLLLCLNGAT